MNEIGGDTGQQATPAGITDAVGVTPATVGERLRAGREAAGLSIEEIGVRTRVPLRHLEAIELGDYSTLPSPTYAVGFARAYARAVGLDDVAVAQAVRSDVNRLGRRQPEYEPYEVTDPARVPSRGLAIVAAGLALALLVLAGLYYGGNLLPGGTPATTAPVATAPADGTAGAASAVVASVPAVRPAAAPTPAANGEVILTANDEVWMRVYDAANTTLYLGTMKPGERFVLPAGANDPMINVGRPDKLAITLNGAAMPPLGTGERAIKDVRIGGAALAGRLAGTPSSGAAPTPEASGSPTASPSPSPSASASPSTAASRRPRPRARPARRLTETQRANLQSLRTPPPAEDR